MRNMLTKGAAAIAAACGLSMSAHAQNQWTNGSGGLFGDPANWSGGAPLATQDLRFALDATYTVTLGADAAADSLTVAGSDLTLDLGGFTLTLTGDGSSFVSPTPLSLESGGSGTALRIANGALATTETSPIWLVGDFNPLLFDNATWNAAGDILLSVADLEFRGAGAGLTAGVLTSTDSNTLQFTQGAQATVEGIEQDPSSLSLGVTATGAGSRLDVSGNVALAAFVEGPTASLQITDQATMTVGGNLFVGDGLVVDNATLDVTGSMIASGIVRNGAAATAIDVAVGGPFVASLIVEGAGSSLTATNGVTVGPAGEFSGSTLDVRDGAAVIGNVFLEGSSLAASGAGILVGSGGATIVGDVLVASGAEIGPSLSVGDQFTITGDLRRSDGVAIAALAPRMHFDFTDASTFSHLTVGGEAALAGFELVVDGDASALALFDTLTLIDAGSITSEFTSVLLPDLAGLGRGAAEWLVIYTDTSVAIQLVPAPGAVALALPLGLAAIRRRR